VGVIISALGGVMVGEGERDWAARMTQNILFLLNITCNFKKVSYSVK